MSLRARRRQLRAAPRDPSSDAGQQFHHQKEYPSVNLILRCTVMMKIITNKIVADFSTVNLAANMPMHAWRKLVESSTFASLIDIKTAFNAVIKIDDFHVFDINGSACRIVTTIAFDVQKLYIRHVFMHKEYDQWGKQWTTP
jgi:mRNA interferase HigB